MKIRRTYLGRAIWFLTVVLAVHVLAGIGPAKASTACGSPIYAAARPPADRVAPIPIVQKGWRSYSLGTVSYLRRCGGYVYAQHQVYIDTRNLPYGHKLWITVSTRRSDGVWARSHNAALVEVTGRQRIEEVILQQRRGVGGGLSVTDIHVQHTATTPGSGALVPRSSTLKGVYGPWNGPEASPR
ncbi:hypothetical protein Acor_47660 [Acrocarpospora corrugata]|uniref:Uncharacterized protein n=1 Tax=Acrocarpospora corrugata TaxID=35763 RepID=A0A5M3W389_9ACTN|nr:hypothetical protein [Acrocarpospora corrugata]GES02700.1 hypothetical protein Acor_47660 [Acrocarpospora corrugata]